MTEHSATTAQRAGANRVAGIHSMDHVVVQVPDLALAQRFYENFGLDVRPAEDGIDLYTFGHDHRWVSLRWGSAKRLDEIVFGAYPDDLPVLARQLAAAGASELRALDNELRFRDPEGVAVRVIAAAKSSPDAKSAPSALHRIAPPGEAAAPLRCDAPKIRPRRLSHVLFFTSNFQRSIDFYCAGLGLRLSDEAGGGVGFLHGRHGSDHHLIAFGQSTGPGLHHSAWDVGSVQEVGQGAMQMTEAGFGENGWGLGRHVLGSNYFHYIRDPWGSYAEYSFDIDFIPPDIAWPEGHHSPENGFYLWGPTPPRDFGHNYELGPAA